MKAHLAVAVGDHATSIQYVVEGHTLVSHTHNVGYRQLEALGLNAIARSHLVDGILYVLEFVSLNERIPTDFRVAAPRYAMWVGEAIESAAYSQFYTEGKPISVTLEDTTSVPLFYARHSKTIHSFKV
jgi:hypothetical protein